MNALMDQTAQSSCKSEDRTNYRVSGDALILGVMALGGLMAFAALLISVSGIAR
jgi:hypothetical protein